MVEEDVSDTNVGTEGGGRTVLLPPTGALAGPVTFSTPPFFLNVM